MNRTPLILGDKWYVIHHNWWVGFQEMKDNAAVDSELMNLPPISNKEITEKVDGSYQLKPKLVEGFNYALIPEDIFEILVSSFGVELEERDKIARIVIKGTRMQKEPFIQIYAPKSARIWNNFSLRQPHQLGLCGLQNLGNTCFMNRCTNLKINFLFYMFNALQCLSNIPELTEYFRENKYLEEINTTNPLGTGGRLVKAYADVINELWAGSQTSVRLKRLKSVIGAFAPRFNGYSQQDSQELVSFLLDGLHEDLNRIVKKPYIEEKERDGRDDTIESWNDYTKRNDSIIVDLMHGQLKSTLVCPECQKISVKFDPFCHLAMPVPAKERLTRSTIVFVRNKKWAKFALTHTNKTTAGQAIHLVKENLGIEPNTRVVLLSSPTNELVSEDAILSPSQYPSFGTNKTYYAFIVSEGPLAIVENRQLIGYDRLIGGAPLVTNFTYPSDNNELTRDNVIENVLPAIREFLWKPAMPDGDSSPPVDDEHLPVEVALTINSQMITYTDDLIQGIKLNGIPHQPVKITLKWASYDQFQTIDMNSLVDREITVAAKKSYSLQECIDLFTILEQLDENDTRHSPQCKRHHRVYKKLDLWALPKILIISLKRFQCNRYTRGKIDTEIIIPTKGLDLSSKVLDPTHKYHKYDLIGISNHSGGLGSGHYTARALNNGTWCEFNDSSAYKLEDHMPESITSREAYILFYRRREASSPDESDEESKEATELEKLNQQKIEHYRQIRIIEAKEKDLKRKQLDDEFNLKKRRLEIEKEYEVLKGATLKELEVLKKESEALKKENEVFKYKFQRRIEESDTERCAICLDAKSTMVFVPCGHVCLCKNCAKTPKLKEKCPICMQTCTFVGPLYFA